MVEDFIEFIDGKKTYFFSSAIVIAGISYFLKLIDINDLQAVSIVMTGFALASMRQSIEKIKKKR